jgi:hypothetical protein
VLTEDAVISLLCEYFTGDGWDIVSRAMPDQRGTDVVATRAGVRPRWKPKARAVPNLTRRGMASRSTRPK